MKCYYHDNQTYGIAWKLLFKKKSCHDKLFKECFKDRTMERRHETHVITFRRAKDIKRCVCTDSWYTVQCINSLDVNCCLDRGRSSVRCTP